MVVRLHKKWSALGYTRVLKIYLNFEGIFRIYPQNTDAIFNHLVENGCKSQNMTNQ